MPTFEIVDAIPSKPSKSKYLEMHMELLKMLLNVPSGKSIRKRHETIDEAKSYANSLNTFIRKQKLADTYFVRLNKMVDEQGKFNVYIEKREI